MNNVLTWMVLNILLAAACQVPNSNIGPLPPINLQCQYNNQPMGLLPEAPFFSWWVQDERQGAIQSAWQIQVAKEVDALNRGEDLLWDSGKKVADRAVQIHYQGVDLEPFTRYYWRVRTWDQNDQASPFSAPSWWETGPKNWTGQWVGDGSKPFDQPEAFFEDHPSSLFRKTFDLPQKPVQARLYISGLGYYEAYLNGEKTGKAVLDPGWTNFGKRVLYTTYDVTALLQSGKNALGVMLGNGWYNPMPIHHFGRWNLRDILTIGQPKLIAELHITLQDGTKQVIISDESWKHGPGWILYNDVYLGERQDGRLKIKDWHQPGFDDANWEATKVTTPPGGQLIPQQQPPVELTKRLSAQKINQLPDGSYLVDFGQNFAGWVQLELEGSPGHTVRLRYGELLNEDGSVNGLTTVATQIKEMFKGIDGGPGVPLTAWQEDTYILGGEGTEYFQPHFTFHGFRYVQIWDYPGKLNADKIEGLRLNANLKDRGTFHCNYEPFNQIQDITEWTFLSNVFSIQSDCPGREKYGYGGDIVTAGEAYIYNYDMANFYRKTVRDFSDDARPSGGMPETAPFNGIDSEGLGENSGPIGWQLAHPFVLDLLYRFYGDQQIVEEEYPATKKLIQFLQSVATNNRINIGLSDHALLNEKPTALTSTLFYYHIVQLGAGFAEILGEKEDQKTFKALANSIKQVLLEEEFNPATGCFSNCNQTSQAIALWYDLLEPKETKLALQRLRDSIIDRRGGHLTTGIFGTKMMFDVTREKNRADLAYLVANQADFPGYRHMLANDATTLWEAWRGGNNGPSHNHPMFGSISEWFYRTIAGINPAKDAIGCDRWVFSPMLTQQITQVEASYSSIRGKVSSKYIRTDAELNWDVEIPANTNASLRIPFSGFEKPSISLDGEVILEEGQIGDTSLNGQLEQEALIIELGSGKYHIEVK